MRYRGEHGDLAALPGQSAIAIARHLHPRHSNSEHLEGRIPAGVGAADTTPAICCASCTIPRITAAPESAIAYPPPGIQSYLTFSIKDATGQELDMKGSRLSLVLNIRKDVQQFI